MPGQIFKGKHPALIDEDTFLKANNISRENPRFGVKKIREKSELPLKIFMKDAISGSPLTGYMNKKKKLFYYKSIKQGTNLSVSAKILNGKFGETLQNFEFDQKYKSRLRKILTEKLKSHFADAEASEKNSRKRISELKEQLEKVEERFVLGEISKEQYMKLHSAFLNAISVSVLTILLFVIIEYIAQGNIAFRTFLFYTWVVISGIAVFVFTAFPIRQLLITASNTVQDAIAFRVGTMFHDIRDTLQNALQLIQSKESYPPSALPFIQAAFEDVQIKTHEKDFTLIIDEEERRRALFIMFASIGLSLLLTIGISPLRESLSRILQYDVSFIPPAPYHLDISPIHKTVLRGSKEEILITVKGSLPPRIVLHVKEEMQEMYDTISIVTDTSHIYRYEIPSTKSTLQYYAHADWLAEQVLSPKGTIIVIDRPEIRSLTGTVSPPSYSKQSGRSLDEQTADILALKGTNVSLEITANKPLVKAYILFLQKKGNNDETDNKRYDTTKILMNVADMTAKGGFSVRQDGEYCISIVDKDGRTNIDPIHHTITAISDNPPTISLIEPQGNAVLTERALLPISVHISDDYGFGGLKLHYRLIESTYAPPMKSYATLSLPLPTNGTLSADVPYTWDLNTIGIAPSDKYEFFIEIIDNNSVTGPGRARTGVISIRLPSLDEVLSQADSVQDKALETLEQTAKDAEKIGKEIEEIQRELLKQDQSMEWKDTKNIENILKKQADLQQQLSEISNQLQEMTNELQIGRAHV